MSTLKRINSSTVIGNDNDLYEAGTLVVNPDDNKVRYYDGSTEGGNLVYPPTGINDPNNIGAHVLRVANGVMEASYSMVVAPGGSSPAPYLSGFSSASFVDELSVGIINAYANGEITTTGNVSVGNVIGNGHALTGITGANVSGTVANANYAAFSGVAASANSVALANVSGAGNIASTNLDGNVSNVLRGDGSWGSGGSSTYGDSNVVSLLGAFGSNTISTTGNIVGGNLLPSANVTYDLGSPTQRWKDIYLSNNTIFLGSTQISSDGSSVTIDGNRVVTSSGSVLDLGSNANVLLSGGSNGQVLATNGAGNLSWKTVVDSVGNIATVNLDGNVANVLAGDGTWIAAGGGGSSANANYANFAGTAYSVDGANVIGAVTLANSAANANVAFSVDGANVFGEVASANFATYSSQTLFVSGANVSGEVASANYATYAGEAYSVSGSNVSGIVANANYAAYANVADSANAVDGINVSGTVANANYAAYATVAASANSVAGANVSGTVANATYAATAGTANSATVAASANSVAGANVTGTVANANYAAFANVATLANSATVANSANSVAVANVSGIGNIATLNINGNASTVLYGNGVFAALASSTPTSIANTNSSVSIPASNGNVVTTINSVVIQNVTSTGTVITGSSNISANLSVGGNASVTGNLSVSGNVSGNTAGFAIGYRDVPQVAASNATLALSDAGKHFYSTTAGNLTLTIPTNANVAFPIGTAVMLVVQANGNMLVNAASGVTLFLAGNSTAANRVLGTFGMATMIKVASDTWFINGTGVS